MGDPRFAPSKASAGEQAGDLHPLDRVQRRAEPGGVTQEFLSTRTIAQGDPDGPVVEPQPSIVRAERPSGIDGLARLGIQPEAIRGPGDELVARGIGAIDDRGPRPIEQRLIGTAVIQLETEELPVVGGRLHVAELFDEPDRIEGLGCLGIGGIGSS